MLLDLNDSRLTDSLTISPNGDYFVLHTFGTYPNPTVLSSSLILFPLELNDLSTDTPIEYDTVTDAVYDWSQDGRWLLISEPDHFRLIAPGHPYDHTITYDAGFCSVAVWINP